MHLQLWSWNLLSQCTALLRGNTGGAAVDGSSALRRRLREALDAASEDGTLSMSQELDNDNASAEAAVARSRSLARLRAQRDFLRATAAAAVRVYSSSSALPEFEAALSQFLDMYPDYRLTEMIDRLRDEEYGHLRVCLDYCGFGLFSSVQPEETMAFTLSEISVNLSNHALYGGAEAGTVENDIKNRILEFLNVPESEYAVVFTVSRGSAFRLLAECYPFENNKRLLSMFDHESQSVSWMAQRARTKGAKAHYATFRWPTLKPCSTELRKVITSKRRRKRDSAVGLFVFPVQSRVTGAKYSYQWMAMAQQNGWHVLLDAGALGPKDMDSLGLSLFRPDFIITSFYRVFGADPSGFGCLLIKKSVISCLQGRNGCGESGMVRIVPVYPQYLSDSMDHIDVLNDIENGCGDGGEDASSERATQNGAAAQLPAFSGFYTSAQVREVFDTEMSRDSCSDRDGASTIFEENESVSVGEVMRSPVFSEDGSSENSFWIDVGQSPLGSEKSGKTNKLGSPLPRWLTKRKNGKKVSPNVACRVSRSPLSPNVACRVSRSPLYDGHAISFDAAVLSVSHDVDCLKEGLEEERIANNRRNVHCRQISDIREETEDDEVACQRAPKISCIESALEKKDSAIRRETEGEFRLLGCREGNDCLPGGSRFFGVDEIDESASVCRMSFGLDDCTTTERLNRNSVALDDEDVSNGCDDSQGWRRRDPEIICRHIDHVDMMGLNRTTIRLRYLINWLVTSLLQLRLPAAGSKNGVHLVHIFGPKIKFERGASVAFNVRNHDGSFVNPEIIQKIAEKNGISLGIGFLSHLKICPNQKPLNAAADMLDFSTCNPSSNTGRSSKDMTFRIEVLTASLGFLTSFEDVYKMWAFLARFLDPSYTDSEQLSTIEEDSAMS